MTEININSKSTISPTASGFEIHESTGFRPSAIQDRLEMQNAEAYVVIILIFVINLQGPRAEGVGLELAPLCQGLARERRKVIPRA